MFSRRSIPSSSLVAAGLALAVGCRDLPKTEAASPSEPDSRRQAAAQPERTAAVPSGAPTTAVPEAVTAAPAKDTGSSTAKAVIVTDTSFDKLTAKGVVLVDFWAPWCPWCQRLAPTIDKLAAEYAGKATVAKLNTDEHQQTPAKYGIRGLPTVIVLKEGRLVAKLEGFRPEGQLRRALDEALAEK